MNEKPESTDPSDDGRTMADMSFDWMPWNRGIVRRGKRRKRERAARDKKTEKQQFRDAVKGQYLAMLPVLFCIIAAFTLIYLLLRLWLKS